MPDGAPLRPEVKAAAADRTLRSAAALVGAGLLDPAREGAIRRVATRYSIAVTPTVRALIDPADPDDPIGRQYLPDEAELTTAPEERADPTADQAFTPVKGVVHRYPDRALLKPLLACPVYCRFCFRREAVGPDGGVLTDAELDAALAWFARTTEVREAILTGGDPLMLSPRRLRRIVVALSALPHVEIIRIHSRVPMADPERISPALLDALGTQTALFLCVHANHAREFTPAAHDALLRLSRAGVALLGQSVLLAGVNDTEAALEALFRAMLRARVKPYYLHQLDPAPGTARFHVSVERGRALLRALRGRMTGLAWPTYVQETPAGGGKAPLGPEFLELTTDGAPRPTAPLPAIRR
jgi:lysine 2,3-aminomutase